jgi:putative ABC transport system permease protein
MRNRAIVTMLIFGVGGALGVAVAAGSWIASVEQTSVRPLENLRVSVLRRAGGRVAPDRWHYPLVELLRGRSDVLRVGALRAEDVLVSSDSIRSRCVAYFVSTDAMRLLQVRSFAGELPASSRALSPGQVAISHQFWTKSLNSDPTVLGRRITANGQAFTIAAVLAPRRDAAFEPACVWLPSESAPAVLFEPSALSETAWRWRLLVQLRPGVSAEAASDRLVSDYPYLRGVRFASLTTSFIDSRVTVCLTLLVGVTFTLALLAVVTAWLIGADLSSRRSREIAVLVVTGAPHARIARRFLAEALVSGMAAAIVALMTAAMTIRLATHYSSGGSSDLLYGIPSWATSHIVALITVGCMVGGAVIACAMFAQFVLAIARIVAFPGTVAAAAKAPSNYRGVPATGFAILYISVATAIGVSVGTLTVALRTQVADDHGLHLPNTLTARVTLSARGPEESMAEMDAIRARLKALTNVREVAFDVLVPFGDSPNPVPAVIDPRLPQGRGGAGTPIGLHVVSSRFTSALALPLIAGNDAMTTSNGALVNQKAAETFWPGVSALGRQIYSIFVADGTKRWMSFEVQGVVPNARFGRNQSEAVPEVFIPMQAAPRNVYYAMLRLDAKPKYFSMRAAISAAVASVGSGAVIDDVDTVDGRRESGLSQLRFLIVIFALAGATCTALCFLGIYVLASTDASRRSQRYGIEIALGATPRRLFVVSLARASGMAFGGYGVGLLIVHFDANPLSKVVGVGGFAETPIQGMLLAMCTVCVSVSAFALCTGRALRKPALRLIAD